VVQGGTGCAGWLIYNTILAFHIASVRKLASRVYFALISKGEIFALNLKPNDVQELLSLFRTQWQVYIQSGLILNNSEFFPYIVFYVSYDSHSRSLDCSVGIATDYGLDDRGIRVRVPIRVKNFLFSTPSRPALGPSRPALGPTQSPIQWVPGALSPGVKRRVREADHSPPTSVEVKKMWIYTSAPPYAFMT
jgi:hypothetical protein